MNPQSTATPVPGGAPAAAATTANAVPSPSPLRSAYSAIPRPSLKAGEVITWVKLDRPKLALGEIVVGSFALAGLVMLISMAAGVVLGHFRSKRVSAHGTQSLHLR